MNTETVAPESVSWDEAGPKLLAALERGLPSAWLVATSGNLDAAAIHDEMREAIALGKRVSR